MAGMKLVAFFTVLLYGVLPVISWTKEGEKNARNNTIKATATYDRMVRPAELMVLEIGLHILTINDLDIKDQIASFTGYLTMDWEDERLVWDSAVHDAEFFFALDSEIWKPELFVDNALDDVTILNDPYLQFRVEKTGVVEWELPQIFTTHCDVNVQYFPFDTQSCQIELTSWAYSVNELVVKPLYEDVKTEGMKKNGEWTIKSTKAETRNFTETKPSGATRTFSVIDFTIDMKRNPSHYISSTILPILATSVLSVLVFILPVESGEKVGYTLTVLLAEAVLLTLVQDSMPSSSQHTSYLSVYLALTLVLGVICVILTVIVIRVHQRSPNIPVPKWVNRLMLGCCITFSCWNGCCSCRKTNNRSVSPTNNEKDTLSSPEDFSNDHLFAWTEVAAIMDWFFFILICSITVLCTVVLMMIIIIGGLTQ